MMIMKNPSKPVRDVTLSELDNLCREQKEDVVITVELEEKDGEKSD